MEYVILRLQGKITQRLMCLKKIFKCVFKEGEEYLVIARKNTDEVFNLEIKHLEFYLSIKGLFMS